MFSEHLEKLRHFVGVARAGSIRNYATTHNLSQPAVSKCVQNLEAVLEASLLIRDRNGVTLTQVGREVFEWSERVLNEAKNLEERVKEHSNMRLAGELNMGTYASIAVYFMPRLFKFIQREQKHLRLQFVSASSGELVSMLRAGKVDFIVSIDPPKSVEFAHTDLFDDTYSLYRNLSGSSKFTDSVIFTLAAAKDGNGRSLESYLKAAKVWGKTVSCGDFEAAKAMLEEDAGMALLPDRVAQSLVVARRIERVKGVPALQSIGRHSVVFSCKAHRASDASIRWIGEQLRLMLRDRV